MTPTRATTIFAFTTTLLLTACGGQPVAESDLAESAGADDQTVIQIPSRFNTGLIDNEDECRLWAHNRNGADTSPCAGEAPSCGAPITFSQVNIIQHTDEDMARTSEGDAPLVTPGFYRYRITSTVQDATRNLAAQLAREGCDTLILGGTEWVTLIGPSRRLSYPYLRAQWGSSTGTAPESAQSAP